MARLPKHQHPHEHPVPEHAHSVLEHEHPASPCQHTCLAPETIKALVKAELDGYEERIRAAMMDQWKKLHDPGLVMEEKETLAVDGGAGPTTVRGGIKVLTRSY